MRTAPHRVALSAVLLTAALGAAACSTASNSTGSAAGAANSAAPSTAASSSGQSAAILAVWHGYVATLTAMYNTARPSPRWTSYAALDAASQGNADVGTFRAQGIVVRGAPTVTKASTPTVDDATSPATASMSVCWDTRGFTPVYAATGKSAVPAGSTPPPPALATVSFQLFSYGWRVTKVDTSGSTPC
ncbi:MAG TPA: hypothetical protein VFA70_08980 [Dehalococcoidia bacterium]|nr:hypothetical protein [Dehalococcoidia bacterium]